MPKPTFDQLLAELLMHEHDSGDITGDFPAAGTDTQIQYNDHNLLGGAGTFTYDKATGDIKIKSGYKLILDN